MAVDWYVETQEHVDAMRHNSTNEKEELGLDDALVLEFNHRFGMDERSKGREGASRENTKPWLVDGDYSGILLCLYLIHPQGKRCV